MNVQLDESILTAVEYADTDTLLRVIDAMCSRRAWEEMTTLRLHCHAAVERGKQVWAIDEHIRYRLALEGPDQLAASVVAEGPARFALGPLTEVASQRHRWVDLEPHLSAGPERTVLAHEFAIRGQTIDPDAIDPMVLDIPATIQPWEPQYATATYHGDRANFPSPAVPTFTWIDLERGDRIEDSEAEEALLDLVTPWTTTSNGVAEVVSVDGDAPTAIGSLGLRRAGIARVEPADALAWMAWAGASGGAYGTRRGAAAGRFGAWWAAGVLAGLDVPPSAAELAEVLPQLGWYLWTDGLTPGWTLRIAVEDEDHGLAWAITALDERHEDIA